VKKFIQTVFFLVLLVSYDQVCGQQHEVVVELNGDNVPRKTFTPEDILALEKLSDDYSGLPKVELVNANYPDGKLSETEKWPEGSWGRGYSTWPKVLLYPQNEMGLFWACHPLMRDVACFIRGHIFLYLNNKNLATSERLAKAGMDYVLDEQIKTGKNKGSFIWYLKRAGQEDLAMEPPVNKVQPYETAYALVAMSEYYTSGIEYRREEVLTAINLTTANLLKIKWAKDPSVGNTNLKALGIWSLSASYRATKNEKTYDQIREITEILITTQNIDSTAENGLWLTGGRENIDGYEIHHDTKIYYHMMNIRGLLEAFSITPDSETETKWRLADGIKRGVNQVITQRLDLTNRQNHKLRYGCVTTSLERLPDWFSYELVDLDKVVETLVKLSYYSKNSPYFTAQEHQSLNNLTYQVCSGLNESNPWYFISISYYIYYMGEVAK
jgi:hypothetical protein